MDEFEKFKAFTRTVPSLTLSRIMGKLDLQAKKGTHRAGLARLPERDAFPCPDTLCLCDTAYVALSSVLTGQDSTAKACWAGVLQTGCRMPGCFSEHNS